MDAAAILTSLGCTQHSYLGDGVYCGHDGYHVWLITEREGMVHKIALERPLVGALLDYARIYLKEPTP